MNRLARLAPALALTGAAAWILDVAVITALDRSFGAIDTALFLGGLVVLVVAVAGAAVRIGRARIAVTVLAFAGLLVAASVVSAIGDGLAHALYDGRNKGLDGEMGNLAIAVVAAAVALWARSSRPAGDRVGALAPEA